MSALHRCPGQQHYLHLLKGVLTRYLNGGEYLAYQPPRDAPERALWDAFADAVDDPSVTLVQRQEFDPVARAEGRDWPGDAETMVGLRRLDNLQACIERILEDAVPGDLLEAGVWRGGASIFMRGVLAAYGVPDRTVWLADSFQGLPPPDPDCYPADTGDRHWTRSELAVTKEEVIRNFERYGLLDGQVSVLEGWFRDTLPHAPVTELALLRVDGDMYESTIVALESLYQRVSAGGFVIIDDYGAIKKCRQAVEDFRVAWDITEPIHTIDWTGIYWRKSD